MTKMKARPKATLLSVLAFSIPAIAASLLEPITGIIDTQLTGHYNTYDASALAMSCNILNSFFWLFNFLFHLSAQKQSQHIDSSPENKIGYAQLALVATLGISTLLAIFLYFTGSFFLNLSDTPESIFESAKNYFNWRCLGLPVALLYSTTLSLLRGKHQLKTILLLIALTSLSNGLLSYGALFIWNLGLNGVAQASIFSHLLGLLIVLIILLREFKALSFFKKHWKKQTLQTLSSESIQLFLRAFFLNTVFFLCMKAVGRIGPIEIAAYQFLWQILLFFSFFMDGIANTGSILLAPKKDSFLYKKQVLRSLFQITLILSAAFAFLLFLFDSQILASFTKDPRVLELCKGIFPFYFVLFVPILAVTYLNDGILFGLNKFKESKNSILIPMLLIFLPIFFYQIQSKEFIVIWIGIFAFNIARGFYSSFKIYKFFNAKAPRL